MDAKSPMLQCPGAFPRGDVLVILKACKRWTHRDACCMNAGKRNSNVGDVTLQYFFKMGDYSLQTLAEGEM